MRDINIPLGGIILIIALALFPVWAFVLNAYKLFQCDFNTPLKCEIVHTIGVVVPPLSMITVWGDDDTQTR